MGEIGLQFLKPYVIYILLIAFIYIALLLLLLFLYSAILRSRADSLRSHVILHE